ncbi:hypothetical protein CPB84DRAFT_1744355 [Gymnopilus junonius]|uniref:Uncharacterized protein n=1 Tax=Gymnopilus junonius TaxID=109634 RepID=A0A9P5TS87_GYMJU|nr:hypothetical protein CPB84DRAFT_1744355 [Gymnopilus junonius]
MASPFARRSQFPPELVDSVIDHNHADRPTLKICALVSRQWTASSRFHLFSRVVVAHDNAREFIQLLSSPHCTVASAVQDLAFQFVSGSQRWFSEFSRRLSYLDKTTNITSLDIPGAPGALIREEVQTALLAFSGQIKTLSFGPVVFESFKDFARLLCAFRALESLSCACTYRTRATGHVENQVLRLRLMGILRQVKLVSPSTKPVLDFLLLQGVGGSPVLPTMASLSLSYLTVEDYPPLTRYLGTPNNNLQSLTIKMDNNVSGTNIDTLAESLNLAQLRVLQILCIDTIPLLSPDQALNLLSWITSQQFANLEISVALIQGIAGLDILLGGDQFHALQKVKSLGRPGIKFVSSSPVAT